MKILYIMDCIDGGGGIEKVISVLASHLATQYSDKIHVVSVNQPHPLPPNRPQNEDNTYERIHIPIKEQLDKVGITYSYIGNRTEIRYVNHLKKHLRLRKIIRNFKPDIIHSHGFHSDLYNTLQCTSIPGVRTLHNEYNAPSEARGIVMERLADFRLSTTIALCSSLKERREKKYKKKNWRVQIIPNPVSDCFFENNSPRATPPSPPYQLGIVGRLHKEKGHAYAIQALEILSQKTPLELHIAGSGSLYKTLQAQVDSLKYLKVHFLGSLTEAEIRKLYDHLDLLLVPSFHEGFNLTAHEALATGLPIVGTDVCGVSDVLKACGRKAIPIEDGPALATEVEALLEDKEEYLRFSAAGIQAVQVCRREEVAKAHHQLYQQLLSK